ncbi:MAG: glutamate synthase, partial [bacterium]
QVRDELTIPRPCIDMRTVGLNAEWSQELKLEESLEEYVKGAMLVEMLRSSGRLPVAPGFADVVYDMSVGYDLAGIRSERVQTFLRGMLDARAHVDRLRRAIPASLASLRDLDFPRRLADTVTLSTFHGCPPHEIERIMTFLLRDLGLHAIVKLNPMLLGPEDTRRLLHDVLGYHDLRVPDRAFERDTTWDQAVDIVGRLRETARSAGVGFGVKLTNTLIVENAGGFLPSAEKEVYLSGPPLHVLSMELVRRFRRTFGGELPISFSAGIDRRNFPDAVALGLVPVTVCTDLLKKGGFGRLGAYHAELAKRMDAVGAKTVPELIRAAYGQAASNRPVAAEANGPTAASGSAGRGRAGDAAGEPLSATVVLNTEQYVERLLADPRYRAAHNEKPPKKIGSRLHLFDCVTCDLCIAACPNDAIFTFTPPSPEIPIVKLGRAAGGRLVWRREGDIRLGERHQIGVFADFCNQCGNCDVFCPEDGGPYVEKPRFHGAASRARDGRMRQGFHAGRAAGVERIAARIDGEDWTLEVVGDRFDCRGPKFHVRFDASDPAGTVTGTVDVAAGEEADITRLFVLDAIRRGVLDESAVNPVASFAAAKEGA